MEFNSLKGYMAYLLANREQITAVSDCLRTMSHALDIEVTYGICYNVHAYVNVEIDLTKYFESWEYYSCDCTYPVYAVGAVDNAEYQYADDDLYPNYGSGVYGQLRWDLIQHIHDNC